MCFVHVSSNNAQIRRPPLSASRSWTRTFPAGPASALPHGPARLASYLDGTTRIVTHLHTPTFCDPFPYPPPPSPPALALLFAAPSPPRPTQNNRICCFGRRPSRSNHTFCVGCTLRAYLGGRRQRRQPLNRAARGPQRTEQMRTF